MSDERKLYVAIAIVVSAVSAFIGWLGYQLGSRPPQTIIIHVDHPLKP